MKKIVSLLSIVMVLVFTGCTGSSSNIYKVKPTPLEKGKSKYVLNEFNLNLTHGHGRNLNNKSFKNEEELKKSFETFLKEELDKKSLLGDSNNGFKVNVDMNYTRTYNYGGNALNKPQFFYTVKIINNNGQLLASYTVPKSTTKYGYLKDVAVNVEIAAFKWDAEDEPKDVRLVSQIIVNELADLGN